jgi:RNA:NAD 2'-phosphotransferase (TPT1/KptA family)
MGLSRFFAYPACQDATLQGMHFYLGNDMVWLADSIPPEWIIVDLL